MSIEEWIAGEPGPYAATAEDHAYLVGWIRGVHRMAGDLSRVVEAVGRAETKLRLHGEASLRPDADPWVEGFLAGQSHGCLGAARVLRDIYSLARMAEMTDGDRDG